MSETALGETTGAARNLPLPPPPPPPLTRNAPPKSSDLVNLIGDEATVAILSPLLQLFNSSLVVKLKSVR